MIHERVSPRTLGFVRVWVFGIWLVHVAADRPQRLAELPVAFFERLGPLLLVPTDMLPGLLSEQVLGAFWALLLACLLLAMLGVRPYRPVAIAAALLLTVHQCLARGFFYTNHQELPLLFVTYALALAPAAQGFTWPRRRAERRESPECAASLMAMTLLFTSTYTLVAAHRLAMCGLDVFFDDNLPHWIARNSYLQTWYGAEAVGAWVLQQPLLVLGLKVGFPLVTVMELLSPLCVVSRRFRWVWIAALGSFHVGTLLLMDVFFWESLLLMPALLLDVERVVNRSPPPPSPR